MNNGSGSTRHMASKSRPRWRLIDLGSALLVFGGGFALVWYGVPLFAGRTRAPQEPLSVARANADGILAPSASQARGGVRRDLVAPLDLSLQANDAPGSATEIRKSRLSEWARLRIEHTRVALSVEMALRFELDARQLRLAEVAASCAASYAVPEAPEMDISAEVEIRDRDVIAHNWGCDVNPSDKRAGAVCECIIDRLPETLHATVPSDIRDAELVLYDGELSLHLYH